MTPETKDEKSLPRGVGGVSALWSAARNPPADATARFDGQTILILGATSGVVRLDTRVPPVQTTINSSLGP